MILIAAVGPLGEIGNKNGLLWNLPNDMKFFRKITMGENVVMGYNTYQSLLNGKGILEGRHHYVLTSKQLENTEQVTFVSHWNEVPKDAIICGGEKIYASALELGLITECLLTMVRGFNGEYDRKIKLGDI